MGEIPTYTRRVRTAPLSPPTVRAPGPSGLDQLGEGIARAGAAVTSAATELQRRQEAALRRVEDAQLNDFETKVYERETFHLDDHEAGLRTKKGFSALEAGGAASTGMSKDLDGLYTEIPEGRVREEAKRRGAQRLAQFHRQVETYQAGQVRAGEASALEGRVAAALRAIPASFRDDKITGPEIFNAKMAIKDAALTPEEGEAQAIAFETKAHASILDAHLAVGDEAGAEGYLGRPYVKEAMRGAAVPYEEKIGNAKARRGALSTVDRALAAARDGDEDGWVDEAKARAAWKPWEIADPKQRELAGADFEEGILLGKRQRAALLEANRDAALTQFNEGGLRAIVPAEKVEWLKRRDPEFWERLKDRAIAKARDWEARQKGKPIPDTQAQTDALTELKLQIYRDPKRFATMTATEFRTSPLAMQLSPRGFEEATDAFVGHQKATAADKGITAEQFKAQADGGQAGFGIPFTGRESQTKRDVYDREMAIYFASIPAGTRPSESELQAAIGRAGIKALGEEKAVKITGERRRERDREARENAPPAGEGPAPAAAAEPPPPDLPLRSLVPAVERRRLPDGRVIEKLADGTTRIAQ